MGVELAVAGLVTLAGGAIKAANSYQTAQANARALGLQNQFQIEMNKINQEVLQMNKEQAIDVGEEQAAQIREQGRQVQGAQAVGFAAQGVDVNTGSAALVQEDTRYLSEIDALTVKNNAMRQAFGYQTAQFEGNLQTAFNSMAFEQKRRQTLVSGGMAAVGDLVGAASSFAGQRMLASSGALRSASSAAASSGAVPANTLSLNWSGPRTNGLVA